MPEIFILRLQGVLQAWGAHTFEDFRPTLLFPTRSALAGLLGACLGVRREDGATSRAVCGGFRYCARLDSSSHQPTRVSDYHTVMNARKADGKVSRNPIVSRRQYLCDARFTVALSLAAPFPFGADRLAAALRAPAFTPVLGRRSCPLSVPLLDRVVSAEGLMQALRAAAPGAGVIYSEEPGEGATRLTVRDVPLDGGRRFGSREVFIHAA